MSKTKKLFKEIKPDVSLVKLEKEILEFWKNNNIFQKSLEHRKGNKPFVFYEGPPTANGKPGAHHVLARSFKDIICRFKSMQGYYVERKAGWDTHGLPVELEVEKELKISGKSDIEKYGIAKFNEKCRQSVMKYTKDWEKLTERIAFWLDMQNPYITYTNDYIETLWWTIKQIWSKGLLYEGYKVVPHCPRCETSLSSHEVAQGYRWVSEDSIFVKFKSAEEPDVYFMAWTTTPWTLTANIALAVGADYDYVLAQDIGGEKFILAKQLVPDILEEGYKVLKTFKGKELANKKYEPLFDFYPVTEKSHKVVPGDFVSLKEGTGIVHIAPAYGEDDMRVAKENDMPIYHPVGNDGKYKTEAKTYKGIFVKDADKLILSDLEKESKLYKKVKYEHSYPFCWRCDTPLLYFAKSSWFIKTTALKDRMIELNKQINWEPSHIKEGRFGNWLENLIDWSFSRERFWGTPLPVWRCQTGKTQNSKFKIQKCKDIVIGSIKELERLGGQKVTDCHRPYVDEITIKCRQCNGDMKRVPEVIDVWFDSGAMPQAQYHYPFENREEFKKNFPADYICEAIDQTRGWFFSLHAVAAMVFDSVAFKNVICLGHILDEHGEKMSKHKGNVVEPWTILNNEGADAFRWHLFTVSPPGSPKKFSEDGVKEVLRKFLLTLWNTYSFFITYANIDGFDPRLAFVERNQRSLLDRWIISKLETLVDNTARGLDAYQITQSAREIAAFVDDLSNWYVRRSRRRFWKSEEDKDKLSAYQTLYEVLVTLSKIAAPFAPFISEEIYRNLVAEIYQDSLPSIHMQDFPQPDLSSKDEEIELHMDTVRQVVTLGRAARFKSKVKVRQPLSELLVLTPGVEFSDAVEKFKSQIIDELNVKELKIVDDESALVELKVKPNFPVLGPKYGKLLSMIAQTLSRANGNEVKRIIDSENNFIVAVNSQQIELSANELLFEQQPPKGLSVESDRGFIVGISTTLTSGLKREGLAREFVHFVQALRKEAGFDIADFINMSVEGSPEMQGVIDEFKEYVKTEILAVDVFIGKTIDGYQKEYSLSGFTARVSISKI